MVKWAYILVGDENTGKAILQREMIKFFHCSTHQQPHHNQVYDVFIRIGMNHTRKIFCMSRSFQAQKIPGSQTIQTFFSSSFTPADTCILSSRLVEQDIQDMIAELKKRFFNICGVFFENSQEDACITGLDWDEKCFIENPKTECSEEWECNLRKGAIELSYHILNKI